MAQAMLIMPIVLAVLFWAVYHYRKDHHLPEPVTHLAVAFMLGLVAAAVSKLGYAGLGTVGLRYDAFHLADTNTPGLFAYCLLAIGPVEEGAKLLPFLYVVRRFREFDEPIDGIVYASFIGLGYAAVENWLYLAYLSPGEAVARSFAGPVVHMLFASIWGYAVGAAHAAGRPVAVAALTGFACAALLHGLYDFIVLQSAVAGLPVAAAGIVAGWIWRLALLEKLARDGQR